MSVLTPETEARVEAFRRALAWGDHFRLLLVSATPGPARAELLERMHLWSERDGVPRLVEIHLKAAERPVARIRASAATLPPGTGIILIGLDQHIARGEQATPAIRELNFFRDELPDILPGPLVLVAAPDAITSLLSTAPDLVSVRAFTLDVETTLQRPLATHELINATPADIEPLTAQLEALERRVHHDPIEHAHLSVRLGLALYAARRYRPAARRIRHAHSAFRKRKSQHGIAHCLSILGDIELVCDRPDSAHDRFTRALRIYRRISDRSGLAHCHIGLGRVERKRLNHEAALAHFRLSATHCHAIGAPRQEADCLFRIGELCFSRLDFSAASTNYETALDLFHQSHDLAGEAHCVHGLALIASHFGDLETARARFEEALALNRRAGAAQGEAHCHTGLGDLAALQGERTIATRHLETARAIYQRIGDKHGLARCLLHSGSNLHHPHPEEAMMEIHDALALFEQTANIAGQAQAIQATAAWIVRTDPDNSHGGRLLRAALAMYEQLGNPLGRANCLALLGEVEQHRAGPLKARSKFREALRLYRRLDNKLGMANCLINLGHIDLVNRTHEPAHAQCTAALELYRKIGQLLGEARCLHYLGKIAAARADPTQARALYEEAIKLLRQSGDTAERDQIEFELQALSEAIPPPATGYSP